MKTVVVVTNPEMGWDCIVGVFDPDWVTTEELQKQFPEKDGYCLFDKPVEDTLDQYK